MRCLRTISLGVTRKSEASHSPPSISTERESLMSRWRNIKTQPEIACPLDAADPHAAVETKRVAPNVIATAEEGPQSIAGVNPALLANTPPCPLKDNMSQEGLLALLPALAGQRAAPPRLY